MPLLPDDYQPSFLFKSKHFSTIFPSLFRKFTKPTYTRTRMETCDGDFFDIDSTYSSQKSQQAILICHGLEGHSASPYVVGMSQALSQGIGCDIHIMNFRTCSGELNRLPSAYNAAISEDLDCAVQWLATRYQEIALVGFSLSANLILNYLGRNKTNLSPIPSQLKAAVAISAPIEMVGSSREIARVKNRIYDLRFVIKLKRKIHKKMQQFPEIMSEKTFHNIKTLRQFDDAYTAPLLGFKNSHEYYTSASSLSHLNKITLPTLILSALNDPFLSPECFPTQICQEKSNLFLLTTKYGGHVGFFQPKGLYYDEAQALQFISRYFTLNFNN